MQRLTLRALIVAAVALAVPTSSALAAAAPVTPGSRYLALGDSVTFGYMEGNVVPAPNYHDASSFLGYPEQIGAELHLVVANAACPGETSSSLIDSTARSNGCENLVGGPQVGYRTLFPLHVHYKGSQLAYAVKYLRAHPTVRLVSLMIGANDLFVCQHTTHDGCTSAAERHAVLGQLAHNVRRILSAIRKRAHYHGQLAIVNYYSLNYNFAFISGASAALNRTVDRAAKPYHVAVADGYGEVKLASAHAHGDPCAAGLLTQLRGGGCGVHLSYAGEALLAQALEKVISLI